MGHLTQEEGSSLWTNVEFRPSRGTLGWYPTACLRHLETACALGAEHDRPKVLDGFGHVPDGHPRILSQHAGAHPARPSTIEHIPDPGHPTIHSPPLRQPPEVIRLEEWIPEQRLSHESRYS